MEDLKVHKAVGSLTNIPHRNAEMDVVYTCEALEHAIDIKNAIREMARVTKPGGMMIVVDKNLEALGCMKMMEWEQYFDENKLRSYMEAFCEKVTVIHGLRLNEEISSSLFSAWIGRRK
jgi:malonyl-CoA O-methyltransferase